MHALWHQGRNPQRKKVAKGTKKRQRSTFIFGLQSAWHVVISPVWQLPVLPLYQTPCFFTPPARPPLRSFVRGVCVCVSACMYTYICIHSYITHTHKHVHTHVHTHTHKHIHTHLHISICVFVYRRYAISHYRLKHIQKTQLS